MAQAPIAAQAIIRTLRVHPRIAYQGLFSKEDERAKLAGKFPSLVAFRGKYAGAMAILDWDHRMPSRVLALRVYCYYSEQSFMAGEAAYDDRVEEIGGKDRFPEFDVPDFGDLPADEAYEAEIDENAQVQGCRLTSAWRRDIEQARGDAAVKIARSSEDFAKIAALDRPRHLGDLEAVSWTPPCESGHTRWTLDVWYLMAFDGRVGSGRSLLVDLDEKRVVALRDFAVRAG